MSNPWTRVAAGRVVYNPDLDRLGELITGPVLDGARTQSGRAAKAVDAWIAGEFRRAGFEPSSVWPRESAPWVLPADVRRLIELSSSDVEKYLSGLLEKNRSIAPADARFLGRAYVKQVDVAMSHWSTGPELLVSTKMMTASFGKNLANRFEEAYGDAGNLRARYPLAAVGFFFVLHASVLVEEPAAFTRAVDMLRKLRDAGDGNGYTATCLVLVDWDESSVKGSRPVLVLPGTPRNETPPDSLSADRVPWDLGPEQFFETMLEQILDASPVTFHPEARLLRTHAQGNEADV